MNHAGMVTALGIRNALAKRECIMNEYLLLLVTTVLINNVLLSQFLGLCSLMGVSNKLDTALSMGLATTFVLTLSAMASWLVEHYMLIPLNIPFLRVLSFILVIAAIVQFTETVIHKTSPVLYRVLGIYLPLITSNCAVLGVALLTVQGELNFLQSTMYGFGASLGYTLVMIIFAGIRERLAVSQVPLVFDGMPIAFITAGLLSMAFMGFSGLSFK
jgi:Na+-translocating ferredoxin:NAD+ oxidoreductase subunit A